MRIGKRRKHQVKRIKNQVVRDKSYTITLTYPPHFHKITFLHHHSVIENNGSQIIFPIKTLNEYLAWKFAYNNNKNRPG